MARTASEWQEACEACAKAVLEYPLCSQLGNALTAIDKVRDMRPARTAETDEQAAERELGAWLVAHPGWTWSQIRLHGDYEVGVRYGVKQVWVGWQSTRAAAISAALAKARGGDHG